MSESQPLDCVRSGFVGPFPHLRYVFIPETFIYECRDPCISELRRLADEKEKARRTIEETVSVTTT